MSSTILRFLLAVPWGGALFGALQFHRLDFHWGHGICGPWGCGPPLESLVGYHAFWLVLLVPIGFVVGAYVREPARRRWGFAIAAAALAGALGWAAWDGYQFMAAGGDVQFLVQRCLFHLSTSVDVPLLQLSLAGVAMAGLASRPRRREDSRELDPPRAETEP